MPLIPNHPPGRSTRKARAFSAEIAQLRAQGYTVAAIREALAVAGLQVSKSTVQRECARHLRPAKPPSATLATTRPAVLPPPNPGQAPCPSDSPAAVAHPPDHRSGRDIAQAFVEGRVTNPLIRSRSTP